MLDKIIKAQDTLYKILEYRNIKIPKKKFIYKLPALKKKIEDSNLVYKLKIINNRKLFIIFTHYTSIKYITQTINDYLEDNLDELILISLDKLTYKDFTLNILKQYLGRLQIFQIKELMYNVLDSIYVPKHSILIDSEKDEFLKIFKNDINMLPKISLLDPIIKYIGGHPNDIVKIYRKNSIYYRKIEII